MLIAARWKEDYLLSKRKWVINFLVLFVFAFFMYGPLLNTLMIAFADKYQAPPRLARYLRVHLVAKCLEPKRSLAGIHQLIPGRRPGNHRIHGDLSPGGLCAGAVSL